MPELPLPEAAGRVAELERPQEVARLLEVRADGDDLVDQILHADDAELAQMVLDELVVRQRDALLVDLAVAALVDQLADGLQVRVAVGDVRVHNCEHFLRSLGETDEDSIIDLEEAEELEDLAWLGGDLGDTV